MKNSVELTAELYNLLTLIYDDQIDDFSRDDILKMIQNAAESVHI